MKLFSALCLLFAACFAQAHSTVALKTAHQSNPLGVDDAQPRFSWRMEGDKDGLTQTACQVLVAAKPASRNSRAATSMIAWCLSSLRVGLDSLVMAYPDFCFQ